MKALAIDSSTSALCFAACNGEKKALLSLDIGMRQSEKLLDGVECVLSHCDLKSENLDYTALCSGPGTFTGLRLAFSALKALSFAQNIPVYAFSTLDILAYPYRQWQGALIPALDAKKHSFYAAIYRNGILNDGPFDASTETILAHTDPEENLLIVGADAAYFAEQARSIRPAQNIVTFLPVSGENGISDVKEVHAVFTLLDLAAKKFRAHEKPIEEYEGPFYMRKSEAEMSLVEQTGKNA
ncbi:tRNA (adenosine(37)-N6)-threonylcarbamoyltransferase complex dimerization subunit type 1 TsaB [Treponema sp. OMZ 840]|uniref:tRNA (adenosine(37)-N6)-threonylcarbamoyltransferase complex dimerization subunit type 1 TsaB n=1 Tax=Treponema sp. OMZ 840 TaxID=244313 RepID=UPI003D8BFBF1